MICVARGHSLWFSTEPSQWELASFKNASWTHWIMHGCVVDQNCHICIAIFICVLMLVCLQQKLHVCGSCVPGIKDLIFMMCSWHSIKWTETRKGMPWYSNNPGLNVSWSWRMVTWIVRMSWYIPPCSYTFSTGCFFMQLFDRGHHPYISTGFGGNHFYSTCLI